mgnify:CR=1 FL=1
MSAPLRMGPCRRAQRPLRVRTQTHSTVMEAQQQNQIMHAVTPLVLSFALACLVAPVASQDVVAHAQQASEQLACKSKKHQQKVVAELQQATHAVTGDYVSAIRSICDDGAARRGAKPKKMKVRKAKKRAPKAETAAWELPHTISYSFGIADFAPLPGKRSERERAARRVPVELALMGMLPGADVALAEIEGRLDSDRSADKFGAFLESWRNGGESFYQALDRTAGTNEGVFFYDAMLGDFVNKVVGRKHPSAKPLKKSHDAAHDALHRAFLSYRQYRGFREAVAMAMILPPDVPFPGHLRRYEAKAVGTYSLREQVVMVLAAYDNDPMAVADLIVASAEPMPTPLWSAHYDPFGAWRSVFEAAMERMLQQAQDTDTFLLHARSARLQAANGLRAIACEVTGVAPLSASY